MESERIIEQWLQDNQPTKGPTLVAEGVKFWSPCSQPKLGEERPLQVISFKDGVGLLYSNPGRDRYNQARKAEFKARRTQAVALYDGGASKQEISEALGIPRRTVNEYLKGVK